MKWSIPLGRVLGIRIGIHITFFLIVAWVAWLGWDYAGPMAGLWAVAMILLLFGCVILHELGHSVVALRFGVEVSHITLLPIGGVAAMRSIPEAPRQELLIAIAGPLVNVIILAILIPIKGFPSWLDAPIIPQSGPELVDAVIRANMILIGFNLIPAFPMDGGRMLRAMLAMIISYPSATAWASGIGRVLAVLFVLMGLRWNPFLALIGFFIFLGADTEYRMVRIKDAVRNLPVARLMRAVFVLPPTATLRNCLEAYHQQGQTHFMVDGRGGMLGLLPDRNWMDALKEHAPEESVQRFVIRRYASFRPETPLDEIIQDIWMLDQQVIPVISNGIVVGLLVKDDVREWIHRREEDGPRTAERFSRSARHPARFSIDMG